MKDQASHYAWLCANLGNRVTTPDGEGSLSQAFSDRIGVCLDDDPKKMRFYTNIFDVVPVENQTNDNVRIIDELTQEVQGRVGTKGPSPSHLDL